MSGKISGHWLSVASAVSLSLLLGFGTLAFWHRLETDHAEPYGQALRSWLTLEHRSSAELLRARAGLVGHYDAIVQTEAARRRALAALADVPRFLPEATRARLRASLREAERRRRVAERLIEQFKREHAVLRISVRYLPLAAAELSALGPDADPSARELVQDALLLQQFRDPAIARRLDTELAAFERARRLAPPSHQTMFDPLLLHVRIARERAPRVDQLSDEILRLSNAAAAEQSSAEFALQLRAAVRREETDTLVLLALSLLFSACVAASIISRMRLAAAVLRRTSAELARAVQSLEAEQTKQRELSELKTRFVSMTSHEFRTPLSVIVSSAELLEAYGDGWSAARKAEHFGRIRTAALGMTRMLEAILLIGRSDSGALECDPEPLELGSFCADVITSMAQTDRDCVRIVLHRPSAPQPVRADRLLLRQVLENLLSNALKYSLGLGEVECHVARADGALSLRVVDRGIGISPEDQARLFETFQRGKNVGNISGTGLGLAVVSRAVRLHGGSVSVQSQLGVGTEFSVRIPQQEATA